MTITGSITKSPNFSLKFQVGELKQTGAINPFQWSNLHTCFRTDESEIQNWSGEVESNNTTLTVTTLMNINKAKIDPRNEWKHLKDGIMEFPNFLSYFNYTTTIYRYETSNKSIWLCFGTNN